jgi:predicted secreted protein
LHELKYFSSASAYKKKAGKKMGNNNVACVHGRIAPPKDAGTNEYSMKVGDSIWFREQGNASTGAFWNETIHPPNIVQIEQRAVHIGNKPGEPSSFDFVITAKEAGVVHVTLTYGRSWEARPWSEYKLLITVVDVDR